MLIRVAVISDRNFLAVGIGLVASVDDATNIACEEGRCDVQCLRADTSVCWVWGVGT